MYKHNILYDIVCGSMVARIQSVSLYKSILCKHQNVCFIKITIIQKDKKFKVRIATNFNYGDHYLIDYDQDFEYYLPFQKGESYFLSQGYNGSLTHKNKNQLDFKMPIGTEIVAVRNGMVIKVVAAHDKQCVLQTCEKYNNYIYVYHNDGTSFTEVFFLSDQLYLNKIFYIYLERIVFAYFTGFRSRSKEPRAAPKSRGSETLPGTLKPESSELKN